MANDAVLLNAYYLTRLIEPNQPGAYVLGIIEADEFKPVYVGRADICLLDRLVNQKHDHICEATHVVWKTASSVKNAYYSECALYHNYLSEGITNLIHPAAPKKSNYVCCFCSNTTADTNTNNILSFLFRNTTTICISNY